MLKLCFFKIFRNFKKPLKKSDDFDLSNLNENMYSKSLKGNKSFDQKEDYEETEKADQNNPELPSINERLGE